MASTSEHKGYALVMSGMNRTGFDFFGRYVGEENGCVILGDPLVLDYSPERELLRLYPMHVPLGCLNVLEKGCTMAMPLEGVAYVIRLQQHSEADIIRMYEDFFAQEEMAGYATEAAPERASEETADEAADAEVGVPQATEPAATEPRQ